MMLLTSVMTIHLPYSVTRSLALLLLTFISTGANTTHAAEEKPTLFENPLGMQFIKIPAGQFMRGSPAHDSAGDHDEPQQSVTISRDFYLQTTEVTQAQWVKLMQGNPSSFRQCGMDCPVDRIDHRWVEPFIQKLNQLEDGISYRLPTEAEWEYAARAGSTSRFHSGNCITDADANVSGQHHLSDCPTFDNSTGPKPVASYPPNAWGLYDMHGNVWELCQDWYAPYPDSSPSGEQITNPTGPTTGQYKVLRGGSWRFPMEFSRAANRFKTIRPIGGLRLVATDSRQVSNRSTDTP